jgi:DNA-binding LytR/AlgR family response regulator
MTILLIEDNPIIAISVRIKLEKHGYGIYKHCSSIQEANDFLSNNSKLDMILTDIQLPDGLCFQLSEWFNKIPTVFFTSFEEIKFQEIATSFPHATFLIKPVHELTLKAEIEKVQLALAAAELQGVSDYGIAVIGKYNKRKNIPFSEMLWIVADGNYTTIQSREKKHTARLSLTKALSKAPSYIVQCHKSYAVNINFIRKISIAEEYLMVKETSIPIGRKYKENLLNAIDA